MKNKLLLPLFLLLMFVTSGTLHAQQRTSAAPPAYTLKGALLDSLTQEGEPYSTIKIVKKSAPQKAVKMAATATNG